MNKTITARILKRIAVVGLLAEVVFGCGKSSKSKVSKEVPTRSGGEVESTSIQFYDGEPILSATGERIAYVSGRTSTPTSLSIKAFWADWPLGGKPQSPRRVTSVDLGQEREISMSPDGTLMVLGVTQSGQKDLYLQTLNEVKQPQALTSDKSLETIGEFSPDSRLYAWTVREGTKTRVKVIAITTASTVDPTTVVTLGADFDGQIAVTWVPTSTANTYKLLLTKTASGNLSSFEDASFSTITELSSIALVPIKLPAPYSNGISLKRGSKPKATLKSLILTVEMGSSIQETIERVGDAPVPEKFTKEKIGVQSKVQVFDWKTLEVVPLTTASSEPIGFDALATSFAGDGKFGVILSRSLFKCTEDEAAQYGLGVLLADLNDSAATPKTSRYTIRLQEISGYPRDARAPLEVEKKTVPEPWVFSFSSGFCGKTLAPGLIQKIDQNITQVAINEKATQDKFRLVYSSRFVPRVDRKCETKIGDLEVRALEWAGSPTVYEIAPNRAEIVHASAIEVPCNVYW